MRILKSAKAKRRPINLFFTELIIALLFFSISGAVILKLFSSADKKTRLGSAKENAMICAQSIAENYSETGSADSALLAVFSERAAFDGGSYRIKLDKLCRPDANGYIELTASEKREAAKAGELARLSVIFSAEDSELFALECSAYIPAGGDGGA